LLFICYFFFFFIYFFRNLNILGMPLKPGYQSHYVLVNGSGLVVGPDDEDVYDELVVNQDTQVQRGRREGEGGGRRKGVGGRREEGRVGKEGEQGGNGEQMVPMMKTSMTGGGAEGKEGGGRRGEGKEGRRERRTDGPEGRNFFEMKFSKL
jgi:hypothetical protein